MVGELCIAINEKRFTFFYSRRDVSFGRILMYYINIYNIMKLHLHLVFHDGLPCALPMIIVRYMYTTIFYYHLIYSNLPCIIKYYYYVCSDSTK